MILEIFRKKIIKFEVSMREKDQLQVLAEIKKRNQSYSKISKFNFKRHFQVVNDLK